MDITNKPTTLLGAELGKEYIITGITAEDDMAGFLFTLGCYKGQTVTVISLVSDNYVIVIKDARYSIDKNLADAIHI